MLARALLFLAILCGAVTPVAAHEVRPAYLQIREIAPAKYDVLWKTPAQGDMRLALNVVLPPACRDVGESRSTPVGEAFIQRWLSVCEGGLAGQHIAIENLEASLTDVILRFEPLTGTAKTLRMDGATPRITIPARQSVTDVGVTYFRLGVEHILFGFDHLLFVLCLLMLAGGAARLLGAITAFTVAHSITLAATTFGWLRLPIAPVEACIALSIAFVAAEILRVRQGMSGHGTTVTARWPWIAALGFGLLHGLGFASALREIGLPDDAVPLALLFFNLGVEAGQILFVGSMLALAVCWRKYGPRLPSWGWRAPPYVAGVLAAFWFLERTMR
jgi:hypothetical protein